MAAATIESKEQKISYEILSENDEDDVLKLLRETFFKVNFNSGFERRLVSCCMYRFFRGKILENKS
jgi:hypothetical protein